MLSLLTVSTGVAFTAGRLWFVDGVWFALAEDYVLFTMLWLALGAARGSWHA